MMHGPSRTGSLSNYCWTGAGCPRVLKENCCLQVVQLEFVKFAVQRSAAHSQLQGRLGSGAVAFLERMDDELLLGLSQREPARSQICLRNGCDKRGLDEGFTH